MNYLILGFDLGDGESLISYQNYDFDNSFIGYNPSYVSLLGQHENAKPTPTILFKNRRGEWNFNIQTIASQNITDIILNFKKQPSSFFSLDKISNSDIENNIEFLAMKEKIITFVDFLFQNALSHFITESDIGQIGEVIICVGHPTKWNSVDVQLYKKILQETVIGKDIFHIGEKKYPSQLWLFPESQAAFLYARNEHGQKWDIEKSRLLIDIGSSTIDVTAVSGENRVYNDGNNYLGARIFDYLIRELYYKKVKNKGNYSYLLDAINQNENVKKSFLFQSRMVKEEFFNSTPERETIGFKEKSKELRVEFSMEELKYLVEQSSIRDILINEMNCNVPEEECTANCTWTECFEQFLHKQKDELEKRRFFVKEIILTGSASQMYFVPECCKKIFGDQIQFISDTNPGISIASGLVMAGISSELAKKFEQEANENIKITAVIERKIPDLASQIAERIATFFFNTCFSILYYWKIGNIDTLNEAKGQISSATSEFYINCFLKTDEKYQMFIAEWYQSIKDEMLSNLKSISKRYGVNFSFALSEHININSINIEANINDVLSGLMFDFLPDIILNTVPNIVGGIFAFFTIIVMGLMSGLGTLMKWALEKLGIGIQDPSEFVQEKLMEISLPKFLRDKISDNDLTDSITRNLEVLKTKITQDITKDSYKKKIVKSIEDKIAPEILCKINEIKYVISGDIENNSEINSVISKNESSIINENNASSSKGQIIERLEV